ncbi:MAG: hypothetical protein JWO31_780 [Phycisphaerales bacterium]|nr:hypothetical protein [Phycisphaerales bacterium]
MIGGMTAIAGQTRDETQPIRCPACAAAMEPVPFGGVTVERCTACRGLWFDAREQERLRDLPGAEAIDLGVPPAGPAAVVPPAKRQCPVCHTAMIGMADHRQPHLHFESCTVCYGAFFDAGEFRDYKEVTLAESVRRLFGLRKK